jgi:hypothetical protein
VLDVRLGPIGDHEYQELGTFRFEPGMHRIDSVYLFIRYDVVPRDRCLPDKKRTEICRPSYSAGQQRLPGESRCR